MPAPFFCRLMSEKSFTVEWINYDEPDLYQRCAVKPQLRIGQLGGISNKVLNFKVFTRILAKALRDHKRVTYICKPCHKCLSRRGIRTEDFDSCNALSKALHRMCRMLQKSKFHFFSCSWSHEQSFSSWQLFTMMQGKRQPWELYQYNRWGVSLGMLASRLWGCIGLRMRTSENLALVCQHRALFACGRPHGVSDCRKFAWGHHLSAMSSLLIFVLGTSRQILSLLQTLLGCFGDLSGPLIRLRGRKQRPLGWKVKLHY